MLLIDAGNSRIKSGFWDGTSIASMATVETDTSASPDDWQRCGRPLRVLVSNVAGDEVARKLTAWVKATWSLEPTFVGVRRDAAGVVTQYENPEQLGVDRWLAALAAYKIAAGAVAVIDAGTALTVDIVDRHGRHLGGSISPGVALMVASLTRNTARLSLDSIEHTDSVATNTAAAISMGCIDAVAGGIDKMRQKVRARLAAEPLWIITGGEAPIIMDISPVEFRHVPDLVLRGLVLVANDPS